MNENVVLVATVLCCQVVGLFFFYACLPEPNVRVKVQIQPQAEPEP